MSANPDAVLAEASGTRTRSLARLWASIDDRLNPILVKEVRQALRGRYFRNLFWFTVVASTGISVLRIISADIDSVVGALGPTFFIANYSVMTIAINVFVPFWAFQSMSGEWDENTYDLLVISNLRPAQLLLGKTLAAAVQSLLFFSAFAPYLVSTFLMGGVDLLSIVVVLVGTLLLSPGLAMVALAAASFGKSRLIRAVLAIVVIGLLFLFGGWTCLAGAMMIERPEVLHAGDFSIAIWSFLTIVPLLSLLALAVGCARLAHESENRSTFLRVMVATTTLGSLGWGVYGYLSSSGFFEQAWLMIMSSLALFVAIVPFLFFVTEAEVFGRRVAKQVPKSKLLALLALPFLPGGGRGLWLYLATAITALAMVSIAIAFDARTHSPGVSSGVLAYRGTPLTAALFVAASFAYGFVLIGLISGLASFHIRSLRGRTGVRLAIPALVIAGIVGPALLGLLFDISSWREFRHPLNLFWTLYEISDDRAVDVAGSLMLLALAVVVTLAVNAPRLSRSIGETLRASAARRERELGNPGASDAQAAA